MDKFLLGIANAKTPVTLTVKVIPKSARNEIAGMLADGTLKVKIAAPPEKGQANEMLRAFFGGAMQAAQKTRCHCRGPRLQPEDRAARLSGPPRNSIFQP